MKTKNSTLTVSGSVCGLLLAGYGAQAQNLFVGDYATDTIIKYSGSTPSTFATGLDYPTGLAFDSAGDLFEGDQFSGNIFEWAGAGTTRTTLASGLDQPGPMAFNTAGDLFVIVNGELDEFSPTGIILSTITSFSSAAGLAFDRAGNLYVSNVNGGGAGAGYITKITPGGVQSTFASGLTYPTGIAFNAAGNLFVADAYGLSGNTADGYDTIVEVTPGGAESVFTSGLNNPGEIAFDRSGDMFVGDDGIFNGNGDITEFAANGTESVFATGLRPTSLAFQGVALPVPEPSTFALAGLGFAAMLAGSHRRIRGQNEQCPAKRTKL
jgi:DNA-binding beta-propeller fold protein YncE